MCRRKSIDSTTWFEIRLTACLQTHHPCRWGQLNCPLDPRHNPGPAQPEDPIVVLAPRALQNHFIGCGCGFRWQACQSSVTLDWG